MKATVFFADNKLVARLADGHEFVEDDPILTADLLWAHFVSADEVTMVDWHTDTQAAPLSGHKVAMYGRLRDLEKGNG